MQAIARLWMRQYAHDYAFEGELVQTEDGRLLRRVRNDLGAKSLEAVPWMPVTIQLDLRAELANLRAAPPLTRPERRVADLRLTVGEQSLELRVPRPLIGDLQTKHPIDRLYAALWGWPPAE